MSSSHVRSIESLRRLRENLVSLSGDWSEVLQQIRFAARQIEEHFVSQWPAYWKRQMNQAEASLSAAMDNLSRLQSGGSGTSYAATEAQQRVRVSRSRLAQCHEKQARAKQVALAIEKACQALAGPVAEVSLHAEVNLPKAAAELARLIDHLSRYAEIPSAPEAIGQDRGRSNSDAIGGAAQDVESQRALPDADS